MWDDSYDSLSPPHSSNKKSSNQVAGDGYDFPSQTLPSKTNQKKTSKTNKFDNVDQLFGSDSDERDSPVVKDKTKTYSTAYNLPEPVKKEAYLSNFVASSGDFEDSILGELLGGGGGGGGAKKTAAKAQLNEGSASYNSPDVKGLGAGTKLEPIETTAINASKSGANNDKSPVSSGILRHSSSPAVVTRSYKDSMAGISMDKPYSSFRHQTSLETTGPNSPISPSPDRNKTSSSYLPSSESNSGKPAPIPHYNSFDAGDVTASEPHGKPEIDEVDDGGVPSFVPSFLDPNRRDGASRRRRLLDHTNSSTDVKTISKLDELDAALGLNVAAPATSGPKVGITHSNLLHHLDFSRSRVLLI